MTLKVIASILDAFNDVPGLEWTLQIIGLYYTIRFGLGKVVKAETRSRVATELQQLWSEIVGYSSKPEPVSVKPAQTLQTKATDFATGAPSAETTTSEQITAPPVYNPSTDQRKMFAGVTGTVQVLIPLTGVVDVDALRAKLEKDLAKSEGEVKSLSGRLSNKGFTDKAPADVVQGTRDALAEAEKQVKLIQERLVML